MNKFTEELALHIGSSLLDYLAQEGYQVPQSPERKAELLAEYLAFLEERYLTEALTKDEEGKR